MRMSEKYCNNNINSDNPLTSRRTDGGKKGISFIPINVKCSIATKDPAYFFAQYVFQFISSANKSISWHAVGLMPSSLSGTLIPSSKYEMATHLLCFKLTPSFH